VAGWVERVVGPGTVRATAPLLPQLASGRALWQLLAAIAPECAPGGAAGDGRRTHAYHARDTVATFLRAAAPLVPPAALFEVRAAKAAATVVAKLM
jgi:hypothetical protein